MEWIIGLIVVVIASGIAFVLGVGSGKEAALKSEKTTFDSTLDYLKPVDEFIDRELLLAMQQLSSSYKRAENGPIFLSWFTREGDEMKRFLVNISSYCSATMSKNLKNAFYRVFERVAEEDTLNRYVIQRSLTYIRDQVVNTTIRKETISDNAQLDNLFKLEIEMGLRERYGFANSKQATTPL